MPKTIKIEMTKYCKIYEIYYSNKEINNNKFIYDISTIKKLALVERNPVYYIINENNQTQYYYSTIIKKDIFNNILYKSPMTRSLFIFDDIRYISTSLWYKFGKLLQDK